MNFTPIKRGVVCPTVTPLKDNGDINPDVIKPMVDFLIDRGVVGVYPLGTTGQGPFFSLDDRKTIAAAAVTAVGGRKPVIIHTGAINTRDTLDLTRHARAVGADAASVTTPFSIRMSRMA